MNRNKLKTYAPKARRAFIQAVTARASKFGITASKIAPVQVQGDVALIGGQAFPRKVADQRRKLEERIALRGFEQVMEEAAYTWFNRFAAIRFMEVHGYFDHGYRVLSHPEGKATPEIIEHAEHIEFPGLDREKVIDLKLDGTKDEGLYRMLLTAQCNALHTAMPFLFERIDDETELLLPDNLLHSDSLVRQMVSQIDEADWQEIEIIGWLYQFYISEKKDQVIGKVVGTEDIPAATQLFTPNWIVRYMVQNSLGAKWLATYPQSGIRAKMEYYIEPAEQTDDVKAELADITPKELNPEELTLLDPACGSGHILVEAYDLFKEIYLERGYALREIPKLILEKNLFGLDIDGRATQLTSFALLMKSREDDRRILGKTLALNVFPIQPSERLDPKRVLRGLAPDEQVALGSSGTLLQGEAVCLTPPLDFNVEDGCEAVTSLIDAFESANAFGSLVCVPDTLNLALPALREILNASRPERTLESWRRIEDTSKIETLMRQAEMLSRHYDCVVANPPYMGSKYFSPVLKKFVSVNYSDAKADLYGCFIKRCLEFLKDGGFLSMITIPNWMFLSAFEMLRLGVLERSTISSIVHNGRGVFGSDFGSAAFTLIKAKKINFVGTYKRLFERQGSVSTNSELERQFFVAPSYNLPVSKFEAIPGRPLAFWLSEAFRKTFEQGRSLEEVAPPKQGLATADNDRFLRLWYEIPVSGIGFDFRSEMDAAQSGLKWFPYNKGGAWRRWYGNQQFVVNWRNNGEEIKNFKDENGKVRSRPQNTTFYFREGITWTDITNGGFAARYSPPGFIFDIKGSSAFPTGDYMYDVLAVLSSNIVQHFMEAINPTITFQVGDVARIPFISVRDRKGLHEKVRELISIFKDDWDLFEASWNFTGHQFLDGRNMSLVSQSFDEWRRACENRIEVATGLEEDVNKVLIEAYGLGDELSPRVELSQITLARADLAESLRSLVSYFVGCAMGRYSLAEPGLVYANAGNEGFDASRYGDFPADDDGIIPITETEWFSDDAANRFVEFLKVAWSPDTLKENLKFVADSLGAKASETPMDTIRRYLSRDFYKEHLKTYKKRPIYWLFSSGKEKAFECLVYLHRYNEGTLSRMRMEYVTPLQGRVSARIEQLDRDIQAASTTAAQKKLRMEQEKLKKQQAELIKFDEELRHYADKRIKLDLDDGVKVNYGKFGNLLAEVKTVTGGSDE